MEYENLPSTIFAQAWCELYKVFGERLDQESLDLMDGIFEAVVSDTQDEMRDRNEQLP